MASDRGATPPRETNRPDSGAEWRWRNYTDHLLDLGYDLGDGSAADDDDAGGAVIDDVAGGSSQR